MPKYMNQASTLDLASRGVTVEANMINASPRIGRDLMTHFQVADIPHPTIFSASLTDTVMR